MNKNNFTEIVRAGAYIAIGLGFLVFAAYSMLLWQHGYLFSAVFSVAVASQIGDFLSGSVGILWSLAATLLFFASLSVQAKTLEHQIKEVRETQMLVNQQRFEATFFSYLNSHEGIIKDLKITYSARGTWKDACGRDVFRIYNEILKHVYGAIKNNSIDETGCYFDVLSLGDLFGEHISGPVVSHFIEYVERWGGMEKVRLSEKNMIAAACYATYYALEEGLSFYFRNMYCLLSFIEQSRNDEVRHYCAEECRTENDIGVKYRYYADMAMARLSVQEIISLFYNGVIFDKYSKLINKFELTECLNVEHLLNPEHASFYTFPLSRRMGLHSGTR